MKLCSPRLHAPRCGRRSPVCDATSGGTRPEEEGFHQLAMSLGEIESVGSKGNIEREEAAVITRILDVHRERNKGSRNGRVCVAAKKSSPQKAVVAQRCAWANQNLYMAPMWVSPHSTAGGRDRKRRSLSAELKKCLSRLLQMLPALDPTQP